MMGAERARQQRWQDGTVGGLVACCFLAWQGVSANSAQAKAEQARLDKRHDWMVGRHLAQRGRGTLQACFRAWRSLPRLLVLADRRALMSRARRHFRLWRGAATGAQRQRAAEAEARQQRHEAYQSTKAQLFRRAQLQRPCILAWARHARKSAVQRRLEAERQKRRGKMQKLLGRLGGQAEEGQEAGHCSGGMWCGSVCVLAC